MSNVLERFIISKHPREYFKQGWNHCGAYSVKGILSAYGKDDKQHPREYHPYWLGEITGTTIGWSYWPNVLQKYGFEVKVGKADGLTNEEKLHLLKSLVSMDNPVMISIGNGYLSDGGYSRLKALFIGHWITVWGYDDRKQIFYVYDSAVPKNLYDRDIPVGNKARSYPELLRDWGTLVWTNILAFRIPQAYLYIAPRFKTESQ